MVEAETFLLYNKNTQFYVNLAWEVDELVYLDNSSTTPVCRHAIEAMNKVLCEDFGNASSLHMLGIDAEGYLDDARVSVAKRLSCESGCITFTSGGTEANNMAVFGAVSALKRFGRRIITSEIEHPSVLNAFKALENEGYEIVWLKPDASGKIRERDIFEAVNSETIFISLMYVNNETGALQPVESVVAAAKSAAVRFDMAKKPLVHCDAVQAFGKIDINVKAMDIDLMSVSAHKLHGPKGAGALYIKKGVRISPLMYGGGQEKGLRPGTENVPAIAGFGAAVEDIGNISQNCAAAKALKEYLLLRLSEIEGAIINSPADALPFIINISLPGHKAETLLHRLEAKEIYVSSGSACSKGKLSHVLKAQGLDAGIIDSSIRISLSRFNTNKDIDALAQALKEIKG